MISLTSKWQERKAALVLLFPAFALLLQSANVLLFHERMLFILALVLPMTTLPSAALFLYRKFRAPANAVVKYALISLVLVVLSSLPPLFSPYI